MQESEAAAWNWYTRLHEKSALLAESPRIGRIREDISPGLSMFPFGDYLIFYDIIPNGIWVVHVIHGARDVRRVLALKPIQP